jgi:hypothetical protein
VRELSLYPNVDIRYIFLALCVYLAVWASISLYVCVALDVKPNLLRPFLRIQQRGICGTNVLLYSLHLEL